MLQAVFDFETLPIAGRPDYPPAPVGLAVHAPGHEPRYISWGHAHGRNNGDEGEARELLWRLWCDPTVRLLGHNVKFDVAVATERWGFPMPDWRRLDDTMILAFLVDPHSRAIGLKELAVDLLQWPADEKDAIADWVVAHKQQLCERWPQYRRVNKQTGKPISNITPKESGKWIFAAPAELVEPYAIGDLTRPRALFDFLYPLVERHGMLAAYDRERALLPILLENERLGMRVDMAALEEACEVYGQAFEHVENQMRGVLRASGLNFDADADVAAVLLERGVVTEADFPRTDKGNLSMSKEELRPDLFTGPNGPQLASALGYRNRLKTCLDTFMRPWLDQARVYGGRITTNWNQVRSLEFGGTRTGRPSTSHHNFLNIAKSFDDRHDGYVHPAFLGVPELPLCRRFIQADKGEVFCHRDFSGQELRVFAHFEQGDLHGQYTADPSIDVHNYVGNEMKRVSGRDMDRTRVKALNFQGMYGGGVPALVRALRISQQEGKALKQFHNQALPGRVVLNEEITRLIQRGEPIRTWGGRLYFEEPRGADGRSKIYKLINYLIQGSAADLTKQTLIDWYYHPDRTARFLVTVYDEINISVPPDQVVQQMALLRHTMEADRLSVKMLSDGKFGLTWGSLTKYDDDTPNMKVLETS